MTHFVDAPSYLQSSDAKEWIIHVYYSLNISPAAGDAAGESHKFGAVTLKAS